MQQEVKPHQQKVWDMWLKWKSSNPDKGVGAFKDAKGISGSQFYSARAAILGKKTKAKRKYSRRPKMQTITLPEVVPVQQRACLFIGTPQELAIAAREFLHESR